MLDQGLLFHDLPNIESIEIHECQELLRLPVKRFKEFTSLRNLSIKNCPMLMSDELLLPPSIEKLTLLDCGNLSEAVMLSETVFVLIYDFSIIHHPADHIIGVPVPAAEPARASLRERVYHLEEFVREEFRNVRQQQTEMFDMMRRWDLAYQGPPPPPSSHDDASA
ncbi:hypothetical protein ZIOFF_050522 [Zingiber officinale]|uniref:Disease resistance protein n=1 Tax=Zingiber officinale TaxID=94328 RepID=A0A8J5FKC7_ZINOF|nr:hypothetical protein ZIOFF_050522 [Zingiber officinale]